MKREKRKKNEVGMEEKSVICVVVGKLEFVDFIKCRRVSRKYKSVIDGILRNMKHNFWCYLVGMYEINEEFIQAFIDNFSGTYFYQKNKLSDEFLIRNYTNLVNYARKDEEFFQYQKCSPAVLRVYAPKEYYNPSFGNMYTTIFDNNIYKDSIIQEYIDSDARFSEHIVFPIPFLSNNENVDNDRYTIIPYIPYSEEQLLKMPKDELNFAIAHSQFPDSVLVKRAKDIHWGTAAKYQKISDYVLYNANLQYEVISKIPDLPYDYIDSHIDMLHWKMISLHHIITPEFMERYSQHVNYNSLSMNPNVPYQIAFEYRNKLNIQELILRNSFTPQQLNTF